MTAAGPSATPKSWEACKSQPATLLHCYQQYFTTVTKEQGPKAALAVLAQASSADTVVEGQCHQIAHEIGHVAATGQHDLAKALAQGSSLCWSGYYHGLVERFISGFDDAKLRAAMPTVCASAANPRYSFNHYNCLHGLGHGVTFHTDGDVFKALGFCDVLSDAWERDSCYSGVFMQNIISDQLDGKSPGIRPDDPVYPCNAVTSAQKPSCYLMVTSNILYQVKYDYARAFRICDGVENGYVKTCYQSMGRDISGAALLDPAKVVQLCSLGAPGLRVECIDGASRNAVLNDHDTVKATALCSIVEADQKARCITARDEMAASL